jgi:hypothetical protein
MKKKISNSEELNNYYKMVNNKLKKYSDMNISQDRIASYLKPGTINFTKFISEDDDLKDVDGIEVVLRDIIQDTYAAFKDGLFKKIQSSSVKKFESYLTESIFEEKELTEKEIHAHERALADIYKVSISHIECINKLIHVYKIFDNVIKKYAVIYNNDEFLKERNIAVDILVDYYINKMQQLDSRIQIESVIDRENIKKQWDGIITNEDIITSMLRKFEKQNIKINTHKKLDLNSVEYIVFEVESDKF